MSNTELPTEILDQIQKLGDEMKHDARAAGLIGELFQHLKSSNETETRIAKAVEKRYVFDNAEISEIVPSNFNEFLVSTIARLGICFEMARCSNLSEPDHLYLKSLVNSAMGGSFNASAAGIDIPSTTEVAERAVAAGFEPILDLAQRVLSIETPRARYKPNRLQQLLLMKRATLSNAEKIVAKYDHRIEDSYQAEITALLTNAQERLDAYRTTGVRDTNVLSLHGFEEYEDYLLWEVARCETLQREGSKERRAAEKATAEIPVLQTEIADLERSLTPLKRNHVAD